MMFVHAYIKYCKGDRNIKGVNFDGLLKHLEIELNYMIKEGYIIHNVVFSLKGGE